MIMYFFVPLYFSYYFLTFSYYFLVLIVQLFVIILIHNVLHKNVLNE